MCSVTDLGNQSAIPCPLLGNIDPEWFDILDADFLNHTPTHWLQFKPQPCSSHFTLAVLYTLILIPGAFGNFLVISLFFRVRSLRNSTNILSLNLALADLLMNSEIPFFIYNSLKCGPSLGVLGCELHGFIGGLSGTAALATITGMAVERLFTIWYPFEMKCFFTTRNSIIASGFIWVYSLTFSLPPLFHIMNLKYVPEGYLTSCSFDYLSKDPISQIFIAVFFIAAYVFPLIIIITSYALIVFRVKKSGDEFEEPGNKRRYPNKNVRVKRNVEIRLVRCALSLIGLWTLAWTPYAVVSFIGLVTDGSMLTPAMSMFPALFAKCASFVDPYVYGYSHPRYQKEIRTRIITLCFPGRRRPIVRMDKMSQCATFSMTSRSRRSGSTSDKKLETNF